jgi:predicted small integral membrane protein
MSDPEPITALVPDDAPPPPRQGFLPIDTNTFDRVFISIILFVAINLFWMRFLEQHASLYIATAISIALGVLIVSRG